MGRRQRRLRSGPSAWDVPGGQTGVQILTDPITRLNAALEGRYAIERELGEGGMATVYLAS